jgi:hypothetical protein
VLFFVPLIEVLLYLESLRVAVRGQGTHRRSYPMDQTGHALLIDRIARGAESLDDICCAVNDLHLVHMQEFRQELLLNQRLKHPNVIMYMGACTTPPNLSIITQWAPKGSLFQLLHK